MPTDLNELYADLDQADREGNQEAAAIIAKRINMVQSSQQDYRTPDELSDGTIDRFMIGLGRGLHDIGQGAKQKALMAFGDEGEAEQYTDQVNREVQRFEQDFPGIGAESFGRFAGWATPGVLTGAVGGILPAIGAGAVEGGIMATPKADWGQAAIGAGLGAAGGGLGAGIPSAVRAVTGRVGREALESMDPDVATLSREAGFRPTIDQIADNRKTQVGTRVFPGRQRKLDEIENTINNMRNEMTSGGPRMQAAYVGGQKAMRKADSEAWDTLWGEPIIPGKEGMRIGEIPVDQQRLVQRLIGLAETPAERKALMELGQHVPISQMDDMNLSGLHQFRSNFAAGKSGWEDAGLSKKTQKKIYAAMSREMRETAERGGGERAASIMNRRIENSEEMYNLFGQARLPEKVASGDIQTNRDFRNLLRSGDEDRLVALKEVMGEGGVPGARDTIIENVFKSFADQKPGKAVSELDKLMPAIEKILPADEAAMFRGLRKVLGEVPRSESDLMKAGRAGALTSLVAGTVANPLIGLITALGTGGLRVAMRRRDVQAILQKLSTTDQSSRLYNALMSELEGILGAGGSGAARETPMTIEIQDGRTP
jgi:hypothetical protein